MKTARELEQEIARFCAKCVNTYSGMPMLIAEGNVLHCRLKSCNRKRVKEKIRQLKELEKARC